MVYSTVCGYCPHIDDDREITIELAEILVAGKHSPQYKKMSYDCPDADECQHMDQYGRCPLFISAPHHP